MEGRPRFGRGPIETTSARSPPGRSIYGCNRVDLEEELWPEETAHLDRCARGRVARVDKPITNLTDFREVGHIEEVVCESDKIVKPGSRGLEGQSEVLENLLGLQPIVIPADEGTARVHGHLARDEDESSSANFCDVRVSGWYGHSVRIVNFHACGSHVGVNPLGAITIVPWQVGERVRGVGRRDRSVRTTGLPCAPRNPEGGRQGLRKVPSVKGVGSAKLPFLDPRLPLGAGGGATRGTRMSEPSFRVPYQLFEKNERTREREFVKVKVSLVQALRRSG